MKNGVKLSPPWEEIGSMIRAFFEDDSDIMVDKAIIYDDNDQPSLSISVYNYDKFIALKNVLRQTYSIGNVTLNVYIYLIADKYKINISEASDDFGVKELEKLLIGNSIFSKMEHVEDIFGNVFNFCLFSKKVIQYYNDNLLDYYGNKSTLAQDIAPIIFNVPNVNYCTDIE